MKINHLEIKDTGLDSHLNISMNQLNENTTNEEIVLLMDELSLEIKKYCLSKQNKPQVSQKHCPKC